VHFRFRLDGGYDFQAVALDASKDSAAFEKHYEGPLYGAKSGYFETTAGMFEISNLELKPLPPGLSGPRPNGVLMTYASVALPPQNIDPKEFDYVLQKKAALRQRHSQLQGMNEKGNKSVITLYALMLPYAAAPFSNIQHLLSTGFFRVWGLGGIWLALTSWFYCDRTFWRYSNHLFEQVFCMRQLFQMDKIVVGRSKLHNLYAILPSYGYSWDRLKSDITPSGDPTHLSDKRIAAAAWFFKLVSFFPLMYFYLFVALLIFGEQMIDANVENRLVTYFRVALGFSFVCFLWLRRSMKSCGELMRTAFRARRIGVESPWPIFPATLGGHKSWIQRWRNKGWRDKGLISAAAAASALNAYMFVAWSVTHIPAIAQRAPAWSKSLPSMDRYWGWTAFATLAILLIWGFSMERKTIAVLEAAQAAWPSPSQVISRVNT
jgi:hypothetical protein